MISLFDVKFPAIFIILQGVVCSGRRRGQLPVMSLCQVLLCEKGDSILYLEKKVLPNYQEFTFR